MLHQKLFIGLLSAAFAASVFAQVPAVNPAPPATTPPAAQAATPPAAPAAAAAAAAAANPPFVAAKGHRHGKHL